MHDEHEPTRDDIAQRAYRRYEERGRAEGNDQADWFEAEREAREDALGRAPNATGSEQRVSNDEGTPGREADDAARAGGTGFPPTPAGTSQRRQGQRKRDESGRPPRDASRRS